MDGGKREGQKDRKKVGGAEGCGEGGHGRGIGPRRVGQMDGEKEGGTGGLGEGGHSRRREEGV